LQLLLELTLALLIAAKYFTNSAEIIGAWLKLPSFVIGIFIVGIGTSLPEMISGIISVQKGVSEILPGNIIGSNISNILFITGLAVVINKRKITLSSNYIYIDLNFLIGSFLYFYIITQDGIIQLSEASIGILIYIIYAIYLIKGESETVFETRSQTDTEIVPIRNFIILLISSVVIYFGADSTIHSLDKIATGFNIPHAIIALTILSLCTTLPELAVNVTAIKNGNPEMALGNVLGSCVFNTLAIPTIASFFGDIIVPQNLLGFSLPIMAASGLLFYLLTQDKRISVWEGLLFISLYILFLLKISTQ
jgi:cation:H+ antiporter